MMGVVEVFPEWLLLLASVVLSVWMCAELDDKRSSLHHPFASTISGVPSDCREHWMPPSKQEAIVTLARAKSPGM
jgi:hypothetical protein